MVIAVLERGLQFLTVDCGHSLWYQLGQSVALAQRQLFYAGHVLDGRFCSHGAVGDDVCHILLAVFLRHVA